MSLPSNSNHVRILIADDEDNTRLALMRALELSGYQVEGVSDGRKAIDLLSARCFDVMLLDLRMPYVNGVQVMEHIHNHCPDLAVIILTAHATLDSAIMAVKAGATDYLLKPQRIAEITAAIERALLPGQIKRQRRHLMGVMEEAMRALQSPGQALVNSTGSISNPRFSLDQKHHLLSIQSESAAASRVIVLTADQTAILAYLMAHAGTVLSNRDIAVGALEYQELSEKEAESIIRPHILRLRRKIEADASHPELIRTVRGVGYSFRM